MLLGNMTTFTNWRKYYNKKTSTKQTKQGVQMILVDLSQIMWSGICAQSGGRVNIDEDLIRHIILNSLRSVRVRYGKEYGEIVVCADGKNYWRKNINKHYKANRKKARDKSSMDFAAIYSALSQIKEDIKSVFPYAYIEVDGAEADDVIGAMCRLYSSKSNPCLIYSSDHDFFQLRRYPGVVQISPMTKKEVMYDMTPKDFLREHIIKGDTGDGVANVFSDVDTLVTEGKRQKSVAKKKLPDWINMSMEQFCKDTGVTRERFILNEEQVDLSKTPKHLVDEMVAQFEKDKKTPIGGWGSGILRYFMKHRMKVMTDSLPDFIFKVKPAKYVESTGGLSDFF